MNEDYTDVVREISEVLFKAIFEQEPDLRSKVHELDRKIYKLLRAVGLQVVSILLAWLSSQETQEAKSSGLIVHRCKRVKYLTVFGAVEIKSPYLRDKNTGSGARPVKDQLKIEHGASAHRGLVPHRSRAVQRAHDRFWRGRVFWASC